MLRLSVPPPPPPQPRSLIIRLPYVPSRLQARAKRLLKKADKLRAEGRSGGRLESTWKTFQVRMRWCWWKWDWGLALNQSRKGLG